VGTAPSPAAPEYVNGELYAVRLALTSASLAHARKAGSSRMPAYPSLCHAEVRMVSPECSVPVLGSWLTRDFK